MGWGDSHRIDKGEVDKDGKYKQEKKEESYKKQKQQVLSKQHTYKQSAMFLWHIRPQRPHGINIR